MKVTQLLDWGPFLWCKDGWVCVNLFFMALWSNRAFLEILQLSGFSRWELAGIATLIQLYSDGVLKMYQKLCSESNLDRKCIFFFIFTTKTCSEDSRFGINGHLLFCSYLGQYIKSKYY